MQHRIQISAAENAYQNLDADILFGCVIHQENQLFSTHSRKALVAISYVLGGGGVGGFR